MKRESNSLVTFRSCFFSHEFLRSRFLGHFSFLSIFLFSSSDLFRTCLHITKLLSSLFSILSYLGINGSFQLQQRFSFVLYYFNFSQFSFHDSVPIVFRFSLNSVLLDHTLCFASFVVSFSRSFCSRFSLFGQ